MGECDVARQAVIMVATKHYHVPRGLRQGPGAGSNFALIPNQEST